MTNAIIYMDGSAPDTEKDKWVTKFKTVQEELSSLITQIEQTGCKITENEKLHGF
jgi:chaperonin cofactor prefoldin